jgi:rhodanese-related sulfurtransferase
MREIDVRELQSWLATDRGAVELVDVREPWETAHCRIEGSRTVPMGEIASRLGELDPDRATVVICHHGTRSMHVVMWLAQQGFSDVINLRGGINAWARDIDPAMPVY